MCDSKIHDKCSGERDVKLGDGRTVCRACAPCCASEYTSGSRLNPDMPTDPGDAAGYPHGMHWGPIHDESRAK